MPYSLRGFWSSSLPPSFSAPSPEPLRRSSRVSHPPSWLQDYATSGHSSFVNLVTTSPVKSKFFTFMAALTHTSDPQSFSEAVREEKWCEAMNAELEALEQGRAFRYSLVGCRANCISDSYPSSQWISPCSSFHSDFFPREGRRKELKSSFQLFQEVRSTSSPFLIGSPFMYGKPSYVRVEFEFTSILQFPFSRQAHLFMY